MDFSIKVKPICLLLVGICLLSGCQKNTIPEKKEDLDFTVVSGTDVPDDLQELIDKKYQEPFEMTYSDGAFLYIVKGYGEQDTGGYNITVKDFYQSEDGLVFDTELFGPKKDEEVSNTPCFPYIVIKAEYIDAPVIFPTTQIS